MVVTNKSAVPVKVTVYAEVEQTDGSTLAVRINGGESAEETLQVGGSANFAISLSGRIGTANAVESVTIGKVYVALEAAE